MLLGSLHTLIYPSRDIQVVVEDVRHSSSFFDSIIFKFCYRECNEMLICLLSGLFVVIVMRFGLMESFMDFRFDCIYSLNIIS